MGPFWTTITITPQALPMCVYIYIYIYIYIHIHIYLPNQPDEQDATQIQFFKQSLTGLTSEFPFSTGCHIKFKEHSQPYYLLMIGKRIIGFIFS